MKNKINGLKAEWNRIIWPDKKRLFRKTTAVVVTSLIVGSAIAVIDLLSQYGVNFVTGLL